MSFVYYVVSAVKLQEYCRKPGSLQFRQISGIACEAQAVGVQLKEREALRAPQPNNVRQIIAHVWLAAGELDVKRSTRCQQAMIPISDFGSAINRAAGCALHRRNKPGNPDRSAG